MLPLRKFNSFAVPIRCLHHLIPANPSQCLFLASIVKFLQIQVSAYLSPLPLNSCKSKSEASAYLSPQPSNSCKSKPTNFGPITKNSSPKSLCCTRFPKPLQTLKNSCFYSKTDSHGSSTPDYCQAPSSHPSAPNPGCYPYIGGRTRSLRVCSRRLC